MSMADKRLVQNLKVALEAYENTGRNEYLYNLSDMLYEHIEGNIVGSEYRDWHSDPGVLD